MGWRGGALRGIGGGLGGVSGWDRMGENGAKLGTRCGASRAGLQWLGLGGGVGGSRWHCLGLRGDRGHNPWDAEGDPGGVRPLSTSVSLCGGGGLFSKPRRRNAFISPPPPSNFGRRPCCVV